MSAIVTGKYAALPRAARSGYSAVGYETVASVFIINDSNDTHTLGWRNNIR